MQPSRCSPPESILSPNGCPSPHWERRDSFNSLPAELPVNVEMRNLAATYKEKPLVTKGIPVKFKVPRCQLDTKQINGGINSPVTETTSDNRSISAPTSPTNYQSFQLELKIVISHLY